MTNPSEQAVPFFDEAAREAASRAFLTAREAVRTSAQASDKPYALSGPIAAALTAALEALPPRSKAILSLAGLSDEELIERVAATRLPSGGYVFGVSVEWGARAVLAALGLPVDEQEPTGGER